MRFLKIYLQTILGPALTTLLFLIIFALALGRSSKLVEDIPFLEFLAPGLIVMAMIQNAFGNTSSSLLSAKVAGNITDLLATSATLAGQTTSFYITDLIKDMNVTVSRLAQGIPIGGELDYLDDGTIGAAFDAVKFGFCM